MASRNINQRDNIADSRNTIIRPSYQSQKEQRQKSELTQQQCQYNNKSAKISLGKRIKLFPQRHQTLGQIQLDVNKLEQGWKSNTQQRRNGLTIKRLKRELYLQEMKEINKNYSQFMKQFKKTKPLYQIKDQQFKIQENLSFEAKREEALKKLRQNYKSISIQQIKEHQKRYLQRKIQKQTLHNPQQVRLTPQKKYFRGKSHQVAKQQLKQFKDSFKQKECESVIKMKYYCQKVLSKVKNKMVSQQQKQRERSSTEPVQISIDQYNVKSDRKGRRLSHKQITISEPIIPVKNPPQFSTISSIPQRKLRKHSVIKDRYDLQNLIYQNKKKDMRIIQNQELIKFGKHMQVNDAIKLQNDYIESIQQKIRILSTKY